MTRPHLVNRISKEVDEGGIKENIIKRLNRLYGLPIKNELELLIKLSSSGLLTHERRWRFAHDTFEEFFAASRLISLIDENKAWPSLQEWRGNEKEFLEVIGFVAEAEPRILEKILRLGIPTSWKDYLSQTVMKLPQNA